MRKTTTRLVALALTIVMMLGMLPVIAFADDSSVQNEVIYGDGKFGYNGYYNVISRKDYVLVPGAAIEYEMVLNNAAGTRRQVLHVIEVDPSNPDVSIVPGYYQIDQLATDPQNESNWSHQELTEMAKYYEDSLGYNIVGGMNTDLYYDTYAPRILVYNGKSIGVKGETSPSSSILYVFKDAEGNVTCDVKAYNKTDFDKYLADGILLHAVSVSFAMTVKDGQLVSKTEERTSSAAARSMVGVKEDGTLVICMNDGRGANNSVGFCNFELGESMLALGCKWAANCDGGGSSTFLSKRVGEENFEMRSVPCDGAQRPTAHGIFVASNVAPTGILDVVNVEADYDIFAPRTTYTFGAEAIDTHGYAMSMPYDASWALSDPSFGTISNGTFISNGTQGVVDIQIISGGKVVGSKTITVADPEIFTLSATSTVVPYTTADKIRTIALPIVSMTGEANVYVDTNAVSVVLSDNAAGILDGFNFTATSDTSISGVTATITYGTISLTYTIEFGKGSEILFNFENGDRAGFMGFEEAKQWSLNNGVNNSLVLGSDDKFPGSDSAGPLAGQFNEYLSSETFISSITNGGQVRNGNFALAWRLDNSDASFASWSYNVLFNVGETIVLRDVANGLKATSLGMWLYVPENAFPAAGKGLAFQSQLYVKNADGSYSCKQDHFMFTSAATGKSTNLNSATNADIPESRWVYVSIDISKYDYLCMPVATDESSSRSPSFIRTYVKPDTADIVTFYIDDITLDYSSAVDDRVLPTITNPTYSTTDTAFALENGALVDGNSVAFSATVSDNAALDLTSGKITVDGVAVEALINGNSLYTKSDVALNAGTHTVAFEVADELGNPAKLTRTFTVEGIAAVELIGRNDSYAPPMAQSVYYVDINVANPESVITLVADIKLNNSNTWETEGAIVAKGFNVAYSYNEISELLTVIIVRDANTSLSGSNTIVSIPVRVWTFDRYNYVNNTAYAPEEMGNKPVVNIDVEVVRGLINNNELFSGSIHTATELTTISSPYHVHDENLMIINKNATSLEAGYVNRTYCVTCKSVVDWGTILPRNTHEYQIISGWLICVGAGCGCGAVYQPGTGIFELDGNLYYAINNELKTGWQDAGDGKYCFAGSDYKLYIGNKTVNGVEYAFDANGITNGTWVTDGNGTRYSYGPGYYTRAWVEMAGKTYYFGRDTYMYTGVRFVKDNPDTPAYWYVFAEDGTVDKNVTVADGLYQVNGDYYIVKDGMTASGIHYIDGSYYLGGRGSGFDRFACVTVNTTTVISSAEANGIIPAGTYTFGADGKMVINHGPVGGYFYDENGFMVRAYALAEFEGSYYYICEYHKYATSKKVYLTADILEGTGLPAGYYEFDAEGKMILPEPLNGPQADGYFYINNVKQLGWKVYEFEGNYYYVAAYNKYVTNKTSYLDKTVLEGIELPVGYYEFDAEGKLIMPEPLNGPQADGYFYINNVKQLGWKVYEFEGNYYYVAAYNKYVTNKTSYLDKTVLAGIELPVGYYEFDAEGKLIMPEPLNGPQADGYFYINNVKQLGWKVYEFEGNYYYVAAYNKYVTNKTTYLDKTVLEGIELPVGYYEIDAEGKLILPEPLNGPQADGYFYINNVKQLGWKVYEFEGNYYYVAAYNKYVTNKTSYLDKTVLEGIELPVGYYEFDEEGKLILK